MMFMLQMKEPFSLVVGKSSTNWMGDTLQAVIHGVTVKQSATKTTTIDLGYNVHLNKEENLWLQQSKNT